MPKGPPSVRPLLLNYLKLMRGQPKRARQTFAERSAERKAERKAEREARRRLPQSQTDE